MGKFSLYKTKADIYFLSGLLIVGSLAFNLVQKARTTSDNLVANVYITSAQVDQLSLKFDGKYLYYDEARPEQIVNYRVEEQDEREYRPLGAPYGEKLLGPITVEVKDGKVAVIDETSDHHYCRIQGWTDTANWPITCAPNYFVIIIEEASL